MLYRKKLMKTPAPRHSVVNHAGAVNLGGAGLTALAACTQPAIDVPLIDSVLPEIRHALLRAHEGRAQGSIRFDLRWQNLSAELMVLDLTSETGL